MTATVSLPRPLAKRLGNRRSRVVALALGVWLVMSLVRVLADANNITGSLAVGAALRTAMPVFLAGLGGLFAERCGVVNIGLEGMMTLGAFFAGWAGWQFGNPWIGILFGVVGGVLGGLLHALSTVTFGIDHIVSGVAINILAPGITRFLAQQAFTGEEGASVSLGPSVDGNLGNFSVPLLSGGEVFGWASPDPLRWIENKDWFFVSDLAGLLNGLTSQLDWLTILVLTFIPLATYILWRTPFGLRLRSVGEKPSAADSLGIDVYRIRYLGLAISGGLAGLGGAYLAINGAGRYSEGQVAGRGFIGLAMLIFGNWRPAGVAIGSALYGFIEGLRLCCGDSDLRALVLLVGVILAAAALYAALRRRRGLLVSTGVLAIGFVVYFVYLNSADGDGQKRAVPGQFPYMSPYILTLLVLVFASQRLRPPKAAGQRWRKGDAS